MNPWLIWLRRLILAGLVVFALCQLDDLLQKFSACKLQVAPLVVLSGATLTAFFIQGLLTMLLCRGLGVRIPLPMAVGLNLKAALFSLVLPFGAAAYKGHFLKSRLGMAYSAYAGLLILTTTISLMAALFLLACGLAGLGYRVPATLAALAATLGLGLLIVLPLAGRRLPARMSAHNLLRPLLATDSPRRLLPLFIVSAAGLLVFVLMYLSAYAALDCHPPAAAALVQVAARNVLSCVAIVPGNFVVQELVDGWLFNILGGELWDGVIATVLLRLSSLMFILFGGLLAAWLLPGKPGSE